MKENLMHVLYISRGRQEEKIAFEKLKSDECIDLSQYHLSKNSKLTTVKQLTMFVVDSYRYKHAVVVSEGLGAMALVGLVTAKIFGNKIILRVKGDLYSEFDDVVAHGSEIQKIQKICSALCSRVAMHFSDLLLPISEIVATILKKKGYKNVGEVVFIPLRLKTRMPTAELNCNFRATHQSCILTATNFNFYTKVELIPDYINAYAPWFRKMKICWIIAGDGHYRSIIAAHEHCLRNEDIVKFVGFQDIGNLFARADCLFYISSLDTLSNVVLESMQRKVPVVVNAEFPVVEITNQKSAVRIIDRYNVQEGCKILHDMLFDKATRELMTSNAEVFLDNFSTENISTAMLRHLKYVSS